MNKQKGLAPILIIVLITAVVFAYLIYSGKIIIRPSQQTVPYNIYKASPVPTGSAKTDTWKIYENKDIGFLVKYPRNWTIENTDSRGLPGFRIKGNEGEIRVLWGEGFGGGCDSKERKKVQIEGEVREACDIVRSDGVEAWSGISKAISNFTIDVLASANAPANVNRETILRILSTFKFTK